MSLALRLAVSELMVSCRFENGKHFSALANHQMILTNIHPHPNLTTFCKRPAQIDLLKNVFLFMLEMRLAACGVCESPLAVLRIYRKPLISLSCVSALRNPGETPGDPKLNLR